MSRKTIFVVEDEEDILELIRFNLVREGYTVATATRGEDAVKEIPRKMPDLILLDLMLPGLDGGRRLHNETIQHEGSDCPGANGSQAQTGAAN